MLERNLVKVCVRFPLVTSVVVIQSPLMRFELCWFRRAYAAGTRSARDTAVETRPVMMAGQRVLAPLHPSARRRFRRLFAAARNAAVGFGGCSRRARTRALSRAVRVMPSMRSSRAAEDLVTIEFPRNNGGVRTAYGQGRLLVVACAIWSPPSRFSRAAARLHPACHRLVLCPRIPDERLVALALF